MFKIKLKTKNGNPIKEKQTFTVFFRIKYKKNALKNTTTAEYTYRIIHRKGIHDPGIVYKMKDPVKSIESLTIRVLLNLAHIIDKLTKELNITPDFVLLISPDLESKINQSWRYLKDTLDQKISDIEFHMQWTKKECEKISVKKEELELLKDFCTLNGNTKFMSIDPNHDKIKYAKSIGICESLNDRFNMQLQIAGT